MTKTKKLLENIKDKIISEVFNNNNNNTSLEEKINFCQELESFGESWRSLILERNLEVQREVEKNDLELEKLKLN